MTTDAWHDLRAALDAAEGPVRFWLRDDDAVAVTPALERLDALRAAAGAPLLLAAIPAGATPALGGWVAERAGVTACQHGVAHRNHAGAGARACELGGERDDAAVLAELLAGRAAMDAAFGPGGWHPLLVPPWNRIRPSLVGHLPAAGYATLSTFAGAALPAVPNLERLDPGLDIIDWRGGRKGRDAPDLARRLAGLVPGVGVTGVGILTHHLAHDAAAWNGLEAMLALLSAHPAARFAAPWRVPAAVDKPGDVVLEASGGAGSSMVRAGRS